jgi:hypothetical protein
LTPRHAVVRLPTEGPYLAGVSGVQACWVVFSLLWAAFGW